MGSTDYKDLRKPYEKTEKTTRMLAANAAHLAGLPRQKTYPEAPTILAYSVELDAAL